MIIHADVFAKKENKTKKKQEESDKKTDHEGGLHKDKNRKIRRQIQFLQTNKSCKMLSEGRWPSHACQRFINFCTSVSNQSFFKTYEMLIQQLSGWYIMRS